MAEEAKKIVSGKKRKVDKWKKKTWFTIIAPKEFAGKEIGTTVAEKPENLLGRTIWVSVRDLAAQARKQHVTIIFKIFDVKGNKAFAKAAGHFILERK
ncbi:MAG: hypothetical protein HYW50_03375 [Candidatus Diapherotrites archaeon]|nr:hypothetical protein [Candidatus Diapherotrites archaeon]